MVMPRADDECSFTYRRLYIDTVIDCDYYSKSDDYASCLGLL